MPFSPILQPDKLVIIVCSTTGEGDPPETARKFWRWLKKKTHPADMLAGVVPVADAGCGIRFRWLGTTVFGHRRPTLAPTRAPLLGPFAPSPP